ncbi:TetR/AcrR family transcriptional regulator [Streptomyces sp. NPDC005435]|uniref:TetR/AcrR family transcriptional regulator n=1 Tax=Streptomyces sp. NPDC005435 TaxID=3154464 RepID=UPI0034543281
MTPPSAAEPPRRSGAETRAAIRRVALDLFTASGYEATSMREIAEVLGIKKASLYYHFAGKEDIVRSLVEQRGAEAEDLLAWLETQPRTPESAKAAVLRWVESFSADKLHGIRFLTANPLLVRTLAGQGGNRIGSALATLVDALAELLPRRTPADVLQLRMALLSINAAVDASARGDFSDEDILRTARHMAATAMDELLARQGEMKSDD